MSDGDDTRVGEHFFHAGLDGFVTVSIVKKDPSMRVVS